VEISHSVGVQTTPQTDTQQWIKIITRILLIMPIKRVHRWLNQGYMCVWEQWSDEKWENGVNLTPIFQKGSGFPSPLYSDNMWQNSSALWIRVLIQNKQMSFESMMLLAVWAFIMIVVSIVHISLNNICYYYWSCIVTCYSQLHLCVWSPHQHPH
jgi:hypothetical protein